MAKSLGVGIIGCGNISTSYLKLAPLFRGLEVPEVLVGGNHRAVAKWRADQSRLRSQRNNTAPEGGRGDDSHAE